MVQPKPLILVTSLVLFLTSAFQFTSKGHREFKHLHSLQASSLKEDFASVKKFNQRLIELQGTDEEDEPSSKDEKSMITFQDFIAESELSATPYKVSKEEEIRLMIAADVSHVDNFYEVRNRMKKTKMALIDQSEFQKANDLEENFNNLMDFGFKGRFNQMVVDDQNPKASILRIAAKSVSSKFDLNKSAEEQLKDLKLLRKKQRSGVMKLVPDSLYKYIDYLKSMYKAPKSKDLITSMGMGAFFSFVVWANSRPRSSFMYWCIGNIVTMSSLLTRNMPEVKAMPGMAKGKVVSWSKNSFKTAVGITALYGLSSGLATLLPLLLFPVGVELRAKTSAMVSLLVTAYFTSFYEVFEKKGSNGWRWKAAMDGISSSDEAIKLESMDNTKLNDLYDFHYEPDVDDYPPRPKYLDEVEPVEASLAGSSGELDEGEAKKHFSDWKEALKDSRRPPVTDVSPETPWVGGKKGMYVADIPGWLSKAYKQNVLKANAWRDVPSKYKKDTTEFVAFEGPLGFRDKSPKWLDIFSTGVWEEKTTVSRRAARAFGSYRKSMRNIDKEIVLQPCDE